jgi:hypothetical protein
MGSLPRPQSDVSQRCAIGRGRRRDIRRGSRDPSANQIGASRATGNELLRNSPWQLFTKGIMVWLVTAHVSAKTLVMHPQGHGSAVQPGARR